MRTDLEMMRMTTTMALMSILAFCSPWNSRLDPESS